MEIKTQITKADLVEFRLFHTLRSVRSRLSFFSWALLPPLATAAALYVITAGHLPRLARLSLLLAVPLYFALFYSFTRRRLAKELEHALISGPTHSELGDKVIDVEESGVRLNEWFRRRIPGLGGDPSGDCQ